MSASAVNNNTTATQQTQETEKSISLVDQITLEVALDNMEQIGKFQDSQWPQTNKETMAIMPDSRWFQAARGLDCNTEVFTATLLKIIDLFSGKETGTSEQKNRVRENFNAASQGLYRIVKSLTEYEQGEEIDAVRDQWELSRIGFGVPVAQIGIPPARMSVGIEDNGYADVLSDTQIGIPPARMSVGIEDNGYTDVLSDDEKEEVPVSILPEENVVAEQEKEEESWRPEELIRRYQFEAEESLLEMVIRSRSGFAEAAREKQLALSLGALHKGLREQIQERRVSDVDEQLDALIQLLNGTGSEKTKKALNDDSKQESAVMTRPLNDKETKKALNDSANEKEPSIPKVPSREELPAMVQKSREKMKHEQGKQEQEKRTIVPSEAFPKGMKDQIATTRSKLRRSRIIKQKAEPNALQQQLMQTPAFRRASLNLNSSSKRQVRFCLKSAHPSSRPSAVRKTLAENLSIIDRLKAKQKKD